MGSTVSWRRAKQEVMKPFWSVLLGLHLPSGKLSDFISHTWPAPGASWVCMRPSAKMDLEVKVFGRNKILYDLALSLDFWPTRSLSARVVPPSSRKWGEERSLNLFVKQDFTPLCPWHDYYLDYLCDYYLKEFTSDKHLLCTLFLHPFWRADRRLIVNVLTRAHLSLVLENANRCKYPAWNPLLHAPRNIN